LAVVEVSGIAAGFPRFVTGGKIGIASAGFSAMLCGSLGDLQNRQQQRP
jgi:hypothetical protein